MQHGIQMRSLSLIPRSWALDHMVFLWIGTTLFMSPHGVLYLFKFGLLGAVIQTDLFRACGMTPIVFLLTRLVIFILTTVTTITESTNGRWAQQPSGKQWMLMTHVVDYLSTWTVRFTVPLGVTIKSRWCRLSVGWVLLPSWLELELMATRWPNWTILKAFLSTSVSTCTWPTEGTTGYKSLLLVTKLQEQRLVMGLLILSRWTSRQVWRWMAKDTSSSPIERIIVSLDQDQTGIDAWPDVLVVAEVQLTSSTKCKVFASIVLEICLWPISPMRECKNSSYPWTRAVSKFTRNHSIELPEIIELF